jgi:hypothetical protein
MARKSTTQEQEKLTDANLAHVIKMLDPQDGTKAWTKKECCQFLGIAYNTTRLTSLLEKYAQKKEYEAKRRSELRGKPPTHQDIVYVISEYLEGSSIDAISKSLYRSTNFVNKILETNSVPIRQPSKSYFRPEVLPESALQDRFEIGEVVFSARHDSLARVEKECFNPNYYGYIYRVWVLGEEWQQYSYVEAYELASLKHLRELGVKV